MPADTANESTQKGRLLKWTNYLKGYQSRFFIVSNGMLSYYRSEEESKEVCRGSMNLSSVRIRTSSGSSSFVLVLSRESRAWHLKASSAKEKEIWLSAIRAEQNSSESEGISTAAEDSDNEDSEVFDLSSLGNHLKDLQTAREVLLGNEVALQRAVNEYQALAKRPEVRECNKKLVEKQALFDLNCSAALTTCQQFMKLAESEVARVEAAFRHEREQAARLASTAESLASNHVHLERLMSQQTDVFFDATDQDFTFKSNEVERLSSASSGNQSNADSASGNRRRSIPARTHPKLNIWAFLKDHVLRDFTRVSWPVNFNEPLSFLQRAAEPFEYSHLLDKAAESEDIELRLAHIAAFAVCPLSSSIERTSKPFNPLMCETYELDLRESAEGFWLLAEQVSHHPPVCAMHVEGRNWTLNQSLSVKSSFVGGNIHITTEGESHLYFSGGGHYSWTRPETVVKGVITGKVWLDHKGSILVTNHEDSRFRCQLYLPGYSYFSQEKPYRVRALVFAPADSFQLGQDEETGMKPTHVIDGAYNSGLTISRITKDNRQAEQSDFDFEISNTRQLWKRVDIPEAHKSMYHFSEFACCLNQPLSGVAPTDSRNRPDIRQLELGSHSAAENTKKMLEEAQRQRLKSGNVQPMWFHEDENGNYTYNGNYFACKESQNWSSCPDIFIR